MYNYIFIVGRAVFWDMQNMCPIAWLVLDYLCDLIYVCDTVVHAHEGLFCSLVIPYKITKAINSILNRVFGPRSDGYRTTEIASSLLAKLGFQN